MKIIIDKFFKLAGELDKRYFPNVKYYRDNKECTNIHYAIELFNNGCMTYNRFIKVLSKNCKETKANINEIVKGYVDLEGFEPTL